MNIRMVLMAAVAVAGLACVAAPESRVRGGDPFVHLENGLYYLTYSSHHVIDPAYNVCLATAPSIKGPWTKQGKGPILAPRGDLECTGHHSLFKDKSGNWKIVFHVRDLGGAERYVYTADAKFVTKDGHPWIDVGEFQPCLLASDSSPSATK